MKLTTIFLLLMLCGTLPAQNTPQIINIPNRQTISLNGDWQIIIDPYETGYYNYRLQPDGNGFFRNRKAVSKSDRVEYDFDLAETLNVPGDWNSQKEKLFLYEGTIWYKKDFDLSTEAQERIFIHFGAVNYHAIVYVNGEKCGEHVGGFTPFNFEITGKIHNGTNFVVVKVDNKRAANGVPTVNTDWWNYGGITRDVNIVRLAPTFIRDYAIRLHKDNTQLLTGWVQLDGPDKDQTLRVALPEIGAETACHTNENGYASFSFTAPVERWSPDQPRRYLVEITARQDTVSDLIGFRTIQTRGSEILLNGEPVYLRGISIHEQAPLREGRANSMQDVRTLLDWAKELNCNFVRLAHYPHNEYMLRTADELGLMVWSEIPVYWTIHWEDEQTYRNAENQLSEMITRDRNRASVILWSVANETPLSDARFGFLSKLVGRARQLDPDRLLTAAMERHYINPHTMMIDDPLGAKLDVLGVNEYIGWYDGLPDKADTLNLQCGYDKPVIISEFGAGAKAGYHGDELTIWSEEYQASVYEHQTAFLDRTPFVAGMSPWILMDFRSPRRPLPGIQDFWNRKGLIAPDGTRKQAFNVLQQFFRQKMQEN
jgi:beta-glucuronidase